MAGKSVRGPYPGPSKVESLMTLTKNFLEDLLFKCVGNNDLENVKTILSVQNLETNRDVKLHLNSYLSLHDTPLTLATRMGYLDIMKCLIDHGANVNQGNYDGKTPIFFATTSGNLESVKLLIESGCDVSKGNRYHKVVS